MSASGGWLLGLLLLATAAGMVIGALLVELRVRKQETAPVLLEPVPIERDTPDLAVVEQGAPVESLAIVRRKYPDGGLGESEVVTAGAYLAPSQYVRIDGDRAVPVPYPEGG